MTTIRKKLALVLGGGGARGALQVGALRAFYERGFRPDLLVGTSAGAINAAFLALHGYTPEGLHALGSAWQQAAELDLLPSNYVRLTLRAILRPATVNPAVRIRDFFIAQGIAPELTFGQLPGPELIVVSSDLNTGRPVLHGRCRDDTVLEALLVSTALPPWVMPKQTANQYLMDGAVVSSLPVEPALQAGATEIVALDLMDARDPIGLSNNLGALVNKLTYAVEQRQEDLELDLARLHGVPVLYLDLTSEEIMPIWDFGHTDALIERGYQLAARRLNTESMPALAMPPSASRTVRYTS